jgi:anti-sigma factor RsiW
MTDACKPTIAALSAYIDGELPPPQADSVAEHLTTCARCSAEYHSMLDTVALLRSQLQRYTAPDVLRARVRSAIATTPVELDPGAVHAPVAGAVTGRPRWTRAAVWAATIVAAVALGSGATVIASSRRPDPSPIASEVLSSHVRSLMPDHLTDIRSTDQHNVKPWFNGRLDYSPNVPRFDDQGFPLVGGRVDYIGNRPVAAVVYSRRQHLINVFSWPSTGSDETVRQGASNGYTMVHWRVRGVEKWVVSDVNAAELGQFAALVRAADSAAAGASAPGR